MKYLNHGIIFYSIREIPELRWILASELGRSSTGRFKQCVFLKSLALLSVEPHEAKCCPAFIELPSGDSGYNEKN